MTVIFATFLSGEEIDERIEDMLHQDFKYETGTETSLQTVKACLKRQMEVIMLWLLTLLVPNQKSYSALSANIRKIVTTEKGQKLPIT